MSEDNKIREKIKYDLDNLTTLEEDVPEDTPGIDEKILEILLNTKDINLKTELNDKEILEISRLEILSQKTNNNVLNEFLTTFKELRVSKDRQGRKEILGAIQDNSTKQQSGFFNQFVEDIIGKKPGELN